MCVKRFARARMFVVVSMVKCVCVYVCVCVCFITIGAFGICCVLYVALPV